MGFDFFSEVLKESVLWIFVKRYPVQRLQCQYRLVGYIKLVFKSQRFLFHKFVGVFSQILLKFTARNIVGKSHPALYSCVSGVMFFCLNITHSAA